MKIFYGLIAGLLISTFAFAEIKGYKIDVKDYPFQVMGEEGKEETETMRVRYQLPLILCNPNIGARQEGNMIEPNQEFKLMEIGAIAQRIEQAKEGFIIVNQNEYDILKKRMEVVSRYYGYSAYEMFRRIKDAKETTLLESEQKSEKSEPK